MANDDARRLDAGDDQALQRLRADFPGHRIRRGVDHKRRSGDWVATLHDPASGVDPTVSCSTPAALRKALEAEAERAGKQARPRRVVHVVRGVGA
ncbi:hypothetical protein [Actinomadura opuntiae]|uniref:hypothetical protein n=1 Tax=Actinomadura sp. OS1-43 TaxID=604315 RepID=UPI00255AAE34|nr:hypothetical protein [Actinomadura sp. OS1-43]MDL4815359.1 hypothetical protein [Actinomadura sp. OS1-43]